MPASPSAIVAGSGLRTRAQAALLTLLSLQAILPTVSTSGADGQPHIDIEAKLQQLRDVFAAAGLVAAYLHGSYAEGCPTPLSDIDFAILFPDDVPDNEYARCEMALGGELSDLLGSDRVDVKALNNAPLFFQAQVIAKGRLIYVGDDEARAWWQWRTMSEWMDFQPLYDYQDKCFAERTREGRFGR